MTNAIMNATSATGSDQSVLVIVVKIWRGPPCKSSAMSVPMSTATRIAAPINGTASNT